MDLFDLRSINAATDELKRRETKVDILSMLRVTVFDMPPIY